MNLVDGVLQGDRLSLARLLTQVENGTAEGQQALRVLFQRTGKAHLVGVTGASGTGKSSLVNRLALHFRARGAPVAIAAVDPSSPFSGGAVLGDRIRMKDLAGDQDVFIRSMASRGALGGLARTTAGIVQVLDAAGYQVIFIETVGAGQAEVDIASLAHTTVVVEAPGMGDEIQAIKAGILEIADILVVNKADRPGADNAEKALRSALDSAQYGPRGSTHHGQIMNAETVAAPEAEGWMIPIDRTISIDGSGIEELAQHIESHLRYLQSTSGWQDREHARLRSQVEAVLQQTLLTRLHAEVPEKRYNEILRQVFERSLSPLDAVEALIQDAGKNDAGKPSLREREDANQEVQIIYGKRIRLRAIERSDLPRYQEWLNDPEVTQGLLQLLPLSMMEEETWFEQMMRSDAEQHPLAIEIRDGDSWRLAGNAGLFHLEWTNRSAEFGIFIGDKSLWDKGYGTEVLQLFLQHAFDSLNLNRIYLRVFATNARATRSYEKAGLIPEGTMRQAVFRNGQYVDVHIMSILRSEWRAPREGK